jgi:hypothetical protein
MMINQLSVVADLRLDNIFFVQHVGNGHDTHPQPPFADPVKEELSY